jgi:hypothetical protein
MYGTVTMDGGHALYGLNQTGNGLGTLATFPLTGLAHMYFTFEAGSGEFRWYYANGLYMGNARVYINQQGSFGAITVPGGTYFNHNNPFFPVSAQENAWQHEAGHMIQTSLGPTYYAIGAVDLVISELMGNSGTNYILDPTTPVNFGVPTTYGAAWSWR